jgi:NAD(P)-dependent dehydrogenase (short-subunit alcohol dehydrogenase family)
MHKQIFESDMLAGKVALVTGGGTGIGTAIVRDLVRSGAAVVIASRKESHILPAAAGLSAELGKEVFGKILDIRVRESCSAVVSEILNEHGSLDILVNNGGGQFLTPAEMIPAKGWDAVIQTNLTGTWNLTRAAADAWMLDHGGKIISITMLTARGFPGMAHSVAARAGVEAMTRTLAVEWAGHNLQLSCIAPGMIASNGLNNYPDGKNLAREVQRHIPSKKLGLCEDISRMVAYLAGPGGNYITGQTFTIDGGASLWGEGWPIPDPDELPEIIIPKEPWES